MTDAADRNAQRIFDHSGSTLIELLEEAKRIDANPLLGQRSKRHHISEVASRFSEWIVPLTACRNKCSHCCNMATAISQEEADLIAAHTGRKAAYVKFDMEEFHRREGYRDIYTGVPCTFLVEGRCSIYEVRPIACRLHHSLEDTPDPCTLSSVKEVGVFNVFAIHNYYINATSMMAEGGALGDIRQFFPATPASVTITEEMLSCGTDSIPCWP